MQENRDNRGEDDARRSFDHIGEASINNRRRNNPVILPIYEFPPPGSGINVSQWRKKELDGFLQLLVPKLKFFGFYENSKEGFKIYLASIVFVSIGFLLGIHCFISLDPENPIPLHLGTAYMFMPWVFAVIPWIILICGFSRSSLGQFLQATDSNDRLYETVFMFVVEFIDEFWKKFKRIIACIAIYFVLNVGLRIYVDSYRFQHQTDKYYMLSYLLWVPMYAASLLSNALVYISAQSCLIHIQLYIDDVKITTKAVLSLLNFHHRLNSLIDYLIKSASPFIMARVILSTFSTFITPLIMFESYMNGRDSFRGFEDFMCLLILELPPFWALLYALRDISLLSGTIPAAIDARLAYIRVNMNLEDPRTHLNWEALSRFSTSNNKGLEIYSRKVDTSFLEFLVSVQLTLIAIIAGLAITPFIQARFVVFPPQSYPF